MYKRQQKKLLAFCNEVGGFGWRQNIDKPEDSATYWRHVLGVALDGRHALEAEQRIDVARYWDGQMGDRFVEDDALRVSWFNARLAHDKNREAWAKRMDEQFNRESVTMDRVKRWLSYYNAVPKMRSAFFKKHGQPLVSGLSTKDKLSLIGHLRNGHLRMVDEAGQVVRAVRTQGMDDATLRLYASYVAEYEGDEAFLRLSLIHI